MITLSLSPFSSFTWFIRKDAPKSDDTTQPNDVERRRIIGDMIAAGACESEYGVQMLMSVFPEEF